PGNARVAGPDPGVGYANYYGIWHPDTARGETKILTFIVAPYLYARDLVCLRMHCIYRHAINGEEIERRDMQIFGPAHYKGVTQGGPLTVISGGETMYGAGCPRTK